MSHLVYILYSQKLNRLYIGATSDLDQRLEFHKNSEARKFTAKAKDWVLFLKIECEFKFQANQIEEHIKKMKSSTYTRNLKKYPEMVQKILGKYEN